MDFLPGTLLDSPLVATVIRSAPIFFAQAALLVTALIVICVGKECRTLRRSARRNSSA